MDGLLASGRYPEACAAITNALDENRWSVRLRWRAREVFLSNGRTEAAAQTVDKVVEMVSAQPRSYRDAPSLVAFGQAALLKGADPKRVLDALFDTAKKADPRFREVYLASGNLALEKHDFALAAKRFEEGLKQLPDDPELQCGLAQAYAPSDSALMRNALEGALKRNSNHVGSLLLLVDNSIDAEEFEQAERLLNRIKTVNPWHPDSWAYRAVLAHLRNQPAEERAARQNALKYWPTNPRVDYLIGLKLSQNYRFAEGASHQRQALRFEADYLPAKAQLAQDLLRLGEETEGWKLAQDVQKEDGYDVAAYNLLNLRDTMRHYVTLTNADFILRMKQNEAAVYGSRVLAQLSMAKSNLCIKYGLELQNPTIVEVFADQKDFAVRTFGMPGNPGFLGVCFGRVVTANSPAAHPGHSVNWEAVLWHEFCHVITLQLTRNKMPRWLSEGISVYEELQANPAWGQRMDPDYREMVLGIELTPVSKLSSAFISPRSEHHLQFAYYESALVVEFVVQRYGFDRLKAVLQDLGEGMEINQAIARNTAPMDQIETQFAAFARQRAEDLGPALDWTKPKPGDAGGNLFVSPNSAVTTNNFWLLSGQMEELLATKQWAAAKPILERLLKAYPDWIGADSGYGKLARVHRELGETNAERAVLEQWAMRDDETTEVFGRLMQLGVAAGDWALVMQNANRYLAVNPLVRAPYQHLSQAAEHLNDLPTAISAYRSLLVLDPPDPAETHFQLARLLHRTGDSEAKRQVLEALEEAPRYREALRLLLELENPSPQTTTNTPTTAMEAKQ